MNRTSQARTRLHLCLILALVGLISAATLVLGPSRIALAQAVAPSWSYTGNLTTYREGHTATRLTNGKVLVAGGRNDNSGALNSAELYDPTTGTWTITGSLNVARISHTAILLLRGKVLVAGGYNSGGQVTNTAELYDPATGTWSSTGDLNANFFGQTATLLLSGKVLIIGYNNPPELYDPAAGTWSSNGSLSTTFPYAYTATLLTNGKVLVAGSDSCGGCGFPINTAELYDPATGVWSNTGNLNAGREGHTATLLPNGKILVVGGYDCANSVSAELYDPATGMWSMTGNLMLQ